MKLKNNLFRSTAAIIATLFALSFTGCGQNPIISESPSSINNVKHLTEEGVYEFLHNPNENYFEGFAVDKEPAFYCPRNCEDGAYIKLFKAPVNSRMTELFIHINEFEFLLKKNGFTLYKKYENYYKQGIVEYAFNGLLPEKQNDCRLSQNVV